MGDTRAPKGALTPTLDATGLLDSLRRDRDAALAARDGLTADRDRLHAQAASASAALDRLEHQARQNAEAQAALLAEREELKTHLAAQGLLVGTLERRMETAKQEAQALLKAQIEAQTEAKLATANARHDVQEAKAALERLGKDHEALKGALAETTFQRDALKADLSPLEEAQAQLAQALDAAQADIAAQQELLAAANAQLVVFQTKHAEAEGRVQSGAEQIAALQAQARLNAERLHDLERERGRLGAETFQLGDALRAAQASAEAALVARSAAEAERARLAGELAPLTAIVASLTTQRDLAVNRAGEVERELGRLGAETRRMETALLAAQANEASALAARTSAESERTRLAGELAPLTAIVADLTQQRDLAMNRVVDVERECGRLGAHTVRLEAEKLAWAATLDEAKRELAGHSTQDSAAQSELLKQTEALNRLKPVVARAEKTAALRASGARLRLAEALGLHPDAKTPDRKVVFALHKTASSFVWHLFDYLGDVLNLPVHSPNGEGNTYIKDEINIRNSLDELRDRRGLFGAFRGYIDCDYGLFSRVAIMLRDPRDLLTSMYHSWAYSHPVDADRLSLINADGELFNPSAALRSQWIKEGPDPFVLEYARFVEKNMRLLLDHVAPLPHARVFHYEDFISDQPSWIIGLLTFFGADRADVEEMMPGMIDAFGYQFTVEGEDKTRHLRQALPGDHARKLKPETIAALNEQFTFYFDRFNAAPTRRARRSRTSN
jgi:chromosome segregation ATPase